MINMKVVARVKGKVDAGFWKRAAEMNAELAKEALQENEALKAELEILKRNKALVEAGITAWQKKAEEAHEQLKRIQAEKEAILRKKYDAEDQSMRTALDLSARLVKAMEELDKVRAEAQNLNIELMDREQRIFVLEQKLGIGDPAVS